jgi:hypothetical protein
MGVYDVNPFPPHIAPQPERGNNIPLPREGKRIYLDSQFAGTARQFALRPGDENVPGMFPGKPLHEFQHLAFASAPGKTIVHVGDSQFSHPDSFARS